MKKYLAWSFLLLILTGLTGCEKKEEHIPELLMPVDVKMDMAEAVKGDIFEISTYAGEVVPYVEEVYFTVDGTLDQMDVLIGDTVLKDEVLASLDQEQIQEQIKELEQEIVHVNRLGEFSDRKAELDIAIAEKELIMLEESGASQEECTEKALAVQMLKLELEQTEELRNLNVQETQEQLNVLQEKAEKNQLTAPFDGTVVYISDAGKGDAVQAYEPVICLADDSRVSLSAGYIPEAVLANADRIYAKILDKEYEISYVPYDENEYIAMVLYGEELKAEFVFEHTEDLPQSGDFAAIMVMDSCKKDVLTIPANALYQEGTQRYVYRQEDDQRVRCDVKVGVVTDTKAEIVEGLEEGDVVYVRD